MIVNVIEIFTEYLSIIFCLHRIAKKKIVIDKYVVIFSVINLLSVFMAYKYQEECRYLMLIMYINFLIYTKMRLTEKWEAAIKIFVIMFIVIPYLQLVVFYFVKFIFIVLNIKQNRYIVGIVVNCLICLLIFLWKREFISFFAAGLRKFKGIFIAFLYVFLAVYILYIYKKADYIDKPITAQILVTIIGVSMLSILWINAENEKKMKAKELQIYETYNRTFEEAIAAIRIRQHEFDNHINAIKCLQFTIENPSDLLRAQNEYCDMLLRENSFNKILKLHTEPILTGFLYSKFMNAKEKGIDVFHVVHAIDLNNIIEIAELIEIIGILFDNAVEALLDVKNSERKLIIKILQESDKKISIEVANKSRKYLNSEIEKFCSYGYSTKGKGRGIGLSRVKEIVKLYKANLCIENINYNGDNYLSFKIIL